MAVRSGPVGPLAVALLAVFAVALPATSQAEPGVLQLISQTREVSVYIETEEDYFESCVPLDPNCQPDWTITEVFPDSDSASGPGPFVSTASRPEFPATFASQDSEITSWSVRAVGSHRAGASFWYEGLPFPIIFHSESRDTDTHALVSFELDAGSAYVLSGSVTTRGLMFSSSSARVRLTGPGDVLVAEVEVLSDPDCPSDDCETVGPELLDASGVLAPGTYTLEAIASGRAGGIHSTSGSVGSSQGGDFEVELQLSAPVALLPGTSRALLALALLGGALRGSWLMVRRSR